MDKLENYDTDTDGYLYTIRVECQKIERYADYGLIKENNFAENVYKYDFSGIYNSNYMFFNRMDMIPDANEYIQHEIESDINYFRNVLKRHGIILKKKEITFKILDKEGNLASKSEIEQVIDKLIENYRKKELG